jgi:membrane protein implicated in regulation of membrane protease activity
MALWIIFLIAAGVFAIGELHTGGFFLAPFAGGAFGAAVASLLGASAGASVAIFAFVSVLSAATLIPLARQHRRLPPRLRTGTAARVGKQGKVLQAVDNFQGTGSVRINGETWTARAYQEGEVLNEGDKALVMEIKGATALVTKDA